MTYGRIRRGPMAADSFTQIRNAVFRDPRLSAKAMGIFGNISTHRDGWGITPESISTQMRDGVNSIKAGLRELEQYGYLQRERERRPDGTLGASTYYITDQPKPVDSPQSPRSEPKDDSPPVEKPTVDQPTVDDRPHKNTIPLGKKISSEKTTSSSPPDPETRPAASADATDGGGGGDSDLRSMAVHIAASLDYQGQTPDRRQRKTVEDRLVAALEGGWTLDGLAVYLHLGNYRPDSVAAFYMAKLHPDRLPPAAPLPAPVRAAGGIRGDLPDAAAIESLTLEDVFGPARRDTADGGLWERAAARARERMAATGARGGTDDRVAGWMAVGRDLAAREPHRPYSDDPWRQPADPIEAAAIPWCGHPDCDPGTRLRDDQACECHPRMQWG